MPRPCLRCGSERIVPDVRLFDRFGDTGAFTASTQLTVRGEPDAWFFKDSASGRLFANVCGDCGYVELHVENYRELYEKHVKATGGG